MANGNSPLLNVNEAADLATDLYVETLTSMHEETSRSGARDSDHRKPPPDHTESAPPCRVKSAKTRADAGMVVLVYTGHIVEPLNGSGNELEINGVVVGDTGAKLAAAARPAKQAHGADGPTQPDPQVPQPEPERERVRLRGGRGPGRTQAAPAALPPPVILLACYCYTQ